MAARVAQVQLLLWLGCRAAVQGVLLGGFFLVPFHDLWSHLPEQAPAPAAGDPSAALGVAVVFALPILLSFLVFVGRPPFEPAPWAPVALLIGAFALVALPALVSLLTYPCCTSDVLDYVNRQRLWAVYGENPLSLAPNPQPADWSSALAHRDAVFGYGPLWWLVARAFTQGAADLTAHLIGLKLLAAACFVVSAGLVWALAPAEQRLLSLVVFAWSPVVLVDGLIRLHNDLVSAPLVLAAVWLWRTQRGSASLATAAAAALVKLSVAPLWLALAVALVGQRRWRALGMGSLISLLLAVALYLPFWMGPATFASLFAQAQRTQWSVGSAMQYLLQPVLGQSTAAVVRGGLAIAAMLLGALCLRQLLLPGPARLVSAAVLLLLVWQLSVPMAFYAQYLIPVVALAAVSAEARIRWLVLGVSVAGMANTVLGVDTLAGGLQGAALNLVGSLILLLGIGLGLLRLRPPQRQPASSG